MESFLGRNFFQNPFGGGMNPMGGAGSGVLEQIQEQVNTNGETLQSLQGGIGGLPSGNLPSGGIGGNLYENTEKTNGMDQLGSFAPLIDNSLFSDSEMSTGGSGEDPIRAQYDKAVEDARQQRANGFMGRVVLPGEIPFEMFSQSQLASANAGPLQSVTDLFNIDNQINNDPRFNLSVGAEQNPGMDYSQFTPKMTDQLQPSNLDFIGDGVQNTGVSQPGSIFSQTLDNYVPTDLFGANGEQGFFNQSSLSEPPRFPTGALRGGGMDQLFGRAFAGKPV